MISRIGYAVLTQAGAGAGRKMIVGHADKRAKVVYICLKISAAV